MVFLYEALTPEEKMDAFQAGTRPCNIKACSDAKLSMYFYICVQKGYDTLADSFKDEMESRGLSVDDPRPPKDDRDEY